MLDATIDFPCWDRTCGTCFNILGGVGVSGKRSRIFGLLTSDIVVIVEEACGLDWGVVIMTLVAGLILADG